MQKVTVSSFENRIYDKLFVPLSHFPFPSSLSENIPVYVNVLNMKVFQFLSKDMIMIKIFNSKLKMVQHWSGQDIFVDICTGILVWVENC